MDGIHDIGGMHGFGAVVEPGGDDVFHEPYEARIFAMAMLSESEGLRTGSGRAKREQMAPAHYLAASYYERWLWSTVELLVESGTVTRDELAQALERQRTGSPLPTSSDAAMAARTRVFFANPGSPLPSAPDARFAPGDSVRARRRRRAVHTRNPRYVRGARGVVERVHGRDHTPDGAVPEPVYSVRFESSELYAESPDGRFSVNVDLWESDLE